MFRPAHALIETRSLAQKPACKDPERNDQGPVITFRAAYVWITIGKLANFCWNAFAGAETCT